MRPSRTILREMRDRNPQKFDKAIKEWCDTPWWKLLLNIKDKKKKYGKL